ncbi:MULTISPECIES: 3-hydroxyacyl-ACP dehydratase FabZ [unclassified Streptomyces]|uniref:3-hydroxyacyl-ACP dehydratase FabZ n=1 Tax=unclassified Streptomyces TaxID=2593676 RepID=UPI00381B42BC
MSADRTALAFSSDEIRALLPHRAPMLLLDRAYDVHPGISGSGIKNVTVAEACFAGHYPDQAILPGVLIVEAMAQLVAVVHASSWTTGADPAADPGTAGRVGYLGAIRQMKFSRLVVPGDQIVLSARLGREFRGLRAVTVEARCDGATVAEGSLTVTQRGPAETVPAAAPDEAARPPHPGRRPHGTR